MRQIFFSLILFLPMVSMAEPVPTPSTIPAPPAESVAAPTPTETPYVTPASADLDAEELFLVFLESPNAPPMEVRGTVIKGFEDAKWKEFISTFGEDLKNWATISDEKVSEIKTALCKIHGCDPSKIKLNVIFGKDGVVVIGIADSARPEHCAAVLAKEFKTGACVNYLEGKIYGCVEPAIGGKFCEYEGTNLCGRPVARVRGLGNSFVFLPGVSCKDAPETDPSPRL